MASSGFSAICCIIAATIMLRAFSSVFAVLSIGNDNDQNVFNMFRYPYSIKRLHDALCIGHPR
jgi:hypothetical protein